jgi:hypothetical protein
MTEEKFWADIPFPGLIDPKIEVLGEPRARMILGPPEAAAYSPAISEVPKPGIFAIIDSVTESPGVPPPNFHADNLGYYEILRFSNEARISRSILAPSVDPEEPYPFLVEPGMLRRILNYLKGFRIINQEQTEIEIPVGEVYCPNIPGCSVAYKGASYQKTHAQLYLSIPGFSGGTGRDAIVAWQNTFKLPQKSARMFVMASLLVRIRQNDDGHIIPTGDVTNVFNDLIVREIPPPSAEFEEALLRSPSTERRIYEFPIGAKGLEVTFEITEGCKHTFGLGTTHSVGGIDINMGFNVDVQTKSKYTYTYTFADGYRYTAQPIQPGSFIFYWAAQPI